MNRSRKPANTAFKQQRLRAWQPILTPKTVLPTFFLLGVVFVVLGAVLLQVSNTVQELSFDYTDCSKGGSPSDTSIANSWTFDKDKKTCSVTFTVKQDLMAPVFLYYRLTNFYQNHRKYVKSYSATQLKGEISSDASSISDCSPLSSIGNKIYYPCGLIANSMFNDTIGIPASDFQSFTINNVNSNNLYSFSSTGISWPSDQDKYKISNFNTSLIAPPKDWKIYRGVVLKSTWAESGITFDPSKDEHFQVWMRTAGLPTFRKLYGKNSADSLTAGQYVLDIIDEFHVKGFDGTKSIVISTTSFLGGKNPFLGVAYVTVGIICLVFGLGFLIKHQLAPRKLGDHTYLSWNQNTPAAAAASTGTSPTTN